MDNCNFLALLEAANSFGVTAEEASSAIQKILNRLEGQEDIETTVAAYGGKGNLKKIEYKISQTFDNNKTVDKGEERYGLIDFNE